MKSLPYKSAFIFAQKYKGTKIKAFYIFFVVPLQGDFYPSKNEKICQNQNFPLIHMYIQLNMPVSKKFKEILLRSTGQ